MLTLQDCIEFAGMDSAEVFAIAHHEHLPDIVALEKAATFLQQDWGAPAVRQMVVDNVRRCLATGDCHRAIEALHLLGRTVELHPEGHDRRHDLRPQSASRPGS